MDITQFFLVSLAVWRLSSLFAVEDGPFNIFAKFRHLVGVRYDKQSETYGTNEFARGLLCIWCSSLYIGAIASLFFTNTFGWWVVYTLAFSTMAITIDRITS